MQLLVIRLKNLLLRFIDAIGLQTLRVVHFFGDFFIFSFRLFLYFLKKSLHKRQLLLQMYLVSIDSLSIIILTGIFTGLALALQSYIGFIRVHAEQFTGLVATMGIVRELGPVLTGILVSAKTGSAIAAEVATMKITEQIDALKTLRVNPFVYLLVPRVVATTVMLPFVTIFTVLFGIWASYLLCVHGLGINAQAYISIIREYLRMSDITGGVLKSVVFGYIVGSTGVYCGYHSGEGARGVGDATTSAVVISSVMVLVSNYLLSSLFYSSGIS